MLSRSATAKKRTMRPTKTGSARALLGGSAAGGLGPPTPTRSAIVAGIEADLLLMARPQRGGEDGGGGAIGGGGTPIEGGAGEDDGGDGGAGGAPLWTTRVYAWGSNAEGQLGLEFRQRAVLLPTWVRSVDAVLGAGRGGRPSVGTVGLCVPVGIACGASCTAVVMSTGELYLWGAGPTAAGATAAAGPQRTPTRVEALVLMGLQVRAHGAMHSRMRAHAYSNARRAHGDTHFAHAGACAHQHAPRHCRSRGSRAARSTSSRSAPRAACTHGASRATGGWGTARSPSRAAARPCRAQRRS